MTEQDIDKYWKEIVNTMNDGLLIVGPDGIVRMVNSALERMSGFSREELIGQPCSIFDCDGCEITRQEAGGNWCRLFHMDGDNMKRCIIRKKDGAYVPVFKKASILKDGKGKTLGAVETLTDLTEIDRRDQRIEQLSRLVDTDTEFHGIIGRSAAMRKVYMIVEKAAQSDAPVIIHGASGSGKELVAQAIHDIGRRKDGPYIQLNCAALNESLLESELFGHVKGAFTGAYRHRQGRFEAAHGGDIFLDEIGDVPMSIQVKLLRVLETKQFERVGDHRPICVDVRIIAATNRNLGALVSEEKFREDLYFRINVIPIHLPSLRERMEDIPLLVDGFIQGLRRKSGKDIAGLSPEAMKLFMSYRWPGNVRELRSALEYAFVIAERGLIEPDQLPVHIVSSMNGGFLCRPNASRIDDAAERDALVKALRESGGNQSRAAGILGISRVTVWNRMRKHGIDLKRIIED